MAKFKLDLQIPMMYPYTFELNVYNHCRDREQKPMMADMTKRGNTIYPWPFHGGDIEK
jgi:hypothetical protein